MLKSMSSDLYYFIYGHLLNSSCQELTKIFRGNKIRYEDVILAGLDALSRKADSEKMQREITTAIKSNSYIDLLTTYIPSPAKNHIPVVRISLISACMANAAHIGLE